MHIQEKNFSEILILTPLTGDLFLDDSDYDDEEDELDDREYCESLNGIDLTSFEAEITEMVARENDMGPGKPTCDLMDYYNRSAEIKAKVESARVSVKNENGILYGCTTLRLKAPLTRAELNNLVDYIHGQYSDGWGEGAEQREIKVDGGSLYVHFNPMWSQPFQEKIVYADRPGEPRDASERNSAQPKQHKKKATDRGEECR